MEWIVPVNEMLRDDITKITDTLLPPGNHGHMTISQIRLLQDSLARVIDSLGEQSAAAQGLNKIITTAEKLRNSPTHTLYLLKDSGAKGGKGEVVALLKVGSKHLFLFDERDTVCEVEPLCVLDFYVKGDRQRRGLGKRLFDYMLQEENAKPELLAIDGPSPKMEQFLRKNYGVERLIRQSNNFAVSPQFFRGDHSTFGLNTPSATPMSTGRFSAPKPPSVAGSVIHGGGNTGYYQENSRGSSRVNTPDLIAGYTPEPEFLADRPQSPPREPKLENKLKSTAEPVSKPSPERPTTLKVDTIETHLQVDGKESAPPLSAVSTPSRRDSQLTDRGYFDVKFYHNKLW